MSGWCTIESDPAVFTEMMEQIGVQDAEVVELPTLDMLNDVQPCYGLVFLFKWKADKRNVTTVDVPNVFFAKQIVNNACATQALINILMNCQDKVKIGDELLNFYSFAKDLGPEQRGECIGASETLQKVHNSFARSQHFTFEQDVAGEKDDVYHFIAYVPKDGFLYELDGLQDGPILAGETGDNWLDSVRPLIEERINYVQSLDPNGNGIMFNLLAVTCNQILKLERELESASDAQRPEIIARIQSLKDAKEQGRTENVRRRHNYIPMALALLKALAAKGELEKLANSALEKAKQKKEEKAAAKKK